MEQKYLRERDELIKAATKNTLHALQKELPLMLHAHCNPGHGLETSCRWRELEQKHEFTIEVTELDYWHKVRVFALGAIMGGVIGGSVTLFAAVSIIQLLN